MTKSKSVETETHICNQVRYKVLTELQSIEKAMDVLLEDNDPGNVKKMVIQPRAEIEEYASCHSGIIEDDDTPWVQNKPWTEHNRIG